MAKIELQGFDTYIRQIEALKADAEKVCKATVYPGAQILADAMRQAVDALPTISDQRAMGNWQAGRPSEALSVSQKAGLQESLGVSPIRKDRNGMVQTSVGFTGYNSVKTHAHPNGQPNALIARSLEKGTSTLKRNRFVENTIRAVKPQILEAMQQEADAQIERIMKEKE